MAFRHANKTTGIYLFPHPSQGVSMAIATPEVYAEMLENAKAKGFAYPAVNVTSSQTLNAALRGFAEAGSDGIVQASTGGAAYWSGASKKDMVAGSLAFAAYAREIAKQYDVNIALHTDHCPKDKLDGFVLPLLAESEKAVARGEDPIFNSHMWDGSAIDLDENLKIAAVHAEIVRFALVLPAFVLAIQGCVAHKYVEPPRKQAEPESSSFSGGENIRESQ